MYHVDILEDDDDDDRSERARLLGPLARLRESAKQFALTEQEWLITTTQYEGRLKTAISQY